MDKINKQELKTPYQALKLLKSELKTHKGFLVLVDKGFIDKKTFFDSAYDLIKDNFQQTGKVFVLPEQVDILIMGQIKKNVSLAMQNLLENDLLDITGVDPEGQLLYKLSEKGRAVMDILNSGMYGEENKEG